jgi:hypothetical protein
MSRIWCDSAEREVNAAHAALATAPKIEIAPRIFFSDLRSTKKIPEIEWTAWLYGYKFVDEDGLHVGQNAIETRNFLRSLRDTKGIDRLITLAAGTLHDALAFSPHEIAGENFKEFQKVMGRVFTTVPITEDVIRAMCQKLEQLGFELFPQSRGSF